MQMQGSVLVDTPSRLPRVGEEERPSIIHKRDPQTTNRQDQKTLCGESTGEFARTHTRKLSGRTEECRVCLRERERRAGAARADGGQPQTGVGTPVVSNGGGTASGVVAVVDADAIPLASTSGTIEINRAQAIAAGLAAVGVGTVLGAFIL